MPIYEYECSEGHRFEEIQKISDQPLKACQACGSPVKKLVSQTAFALKGEGWYQDGYASKKVKPPSEKKTAKPSGEATSTPTSKKDNQIKGEKS